MRNEHQANLALAKQAKASQSSLMNERKPLDLRDKTGQSMSQMEWVEVKGRWVLCPKG